jgi:hypothetical protein
MVKNSTSHAQQITQFFNAIEDDSVSVSEEGIELAIRVLASLDASLTCRSTMTELFRKLSITSKQRPILRRGLSKHKKRALLFMAPPEKTKELQKRVSQAAQEQVKELKIDRRVSRVNQSHIKQKLASTNSGVRAGFTDVSAAAEGAQYLDPTATEEQRSAYRRLLHDQRIDAAHALELRKAMMVQVYTEIDYIALADFK